MLRRSLHTAIAVLALWCLATYLAGYWLLPPLLLKAPMPVREEAVRAAIRANLVTPGASWDCAGIKGGEDRPLEAEGVPRQRIVLAGWSMGASVALLALQDLEIEGGPLGGALLECPFADMRAATKDHLRGTLGLFEFLARPAEVLALEQAGWLAHFDYKAVSPVLASEKLRTPVALISGDADREAPVAGVRAIAVHHTDLTVVPGAGHCEASNRLPGGWGGWALVRIHRWGARRDVQNLSSKE